MRWLHRVGAFPLDRFVVVDADVIRDRLPETPSLVAANRSTAGSLTQAEAGFIAELLEREALAAGRNTLVDGSLRDAGWYAGVIRRVRAEHAAYRVAILLVTAAPDTIYKRAARRARVTGREVPRALLDDALRRVPASFAALAPLADYAAVIANEGDTAPVLLPPATLESFAAVWRTPPAGAGGDGGGGRAAEVAAAAAGTE